MSIGRCQRHSQPSTIRTLILRPRDPRHGGQRGSARHQMQKMSTGTFHDDARLPFRDEDSTPQHGNRPPRGSSPASATSSAWRARESDDGAALKPPDPRIALQAEGGAVADRPAPRPGGHRTGAAASARRTRLGTPRARGPLSGRRRWPPRRRPRSRRSSAEARSSGSGCPAPSARQPLWPTWP